MKSVGFKEWAIVCQALGEGRQSLILRKGGIAEGRDGFAFRHNEFFLFPTLFHEQIEKTRLKDMSALPQPNESQVEIRCFVRTEHVFLVESWETAAALEPFHILQEPVVRERFEDGRAPGIHVACVRVFRCQPRWVLPNEKSYGGCRSWVELPERPLKLGFEPVLTDAEHAEIEKRFLGVIAQGRGISKAPVGGLETAAP
jgi:hypothetical protein